MTHMPICCKRAVDEQVASATMPTSSFKGQDVEQCMLSAGDRRVSAAYLMDPVDNTTFTPESEDYPSAAKALRRTQKPVGITGAGLIGRCNPHGSNFNVRSHLCDPPIFCACARCTDSVELSALCVLHARHMLICMPPACRVSEPVLCWYVHACRSSGVRRRLDHG